MIMTAASILVAKRFKTIGTVAFVDTCWSSQTPLLISEAVCAHGDCGALQAN